MGNTNHQIPIKTLAEVVGDRAAAVNQNPDEALDEACGSIYKINQEEIKKFRTVLVTLYDRIALQQEEHRQSIFQDILILDKDNYQSVDAIYQLEDALSKAMKSTPGYYALHILESLITYCVNRLTGNGPRRCNEYNQ